MILYSILMYILLFTQAPIPVCLDGTIIDSSTILVTMYTVVMLGYDWWLCIVINISVQYSGGLLPDIILLTQGYFFFFLFFFFFFFFISLIADGPHITILPVVTKDLPISPRFTPYIFFIAMQVQHSYNSSTNG